MEEKTQAENKRPERRRRSRLRSAAPGLSVLPNEVSVHLLSQGRTAEVDPKENSKPGSKPTVSSDYGPGMKIVHICKMYDVSFQAKLLIRFAPDPRVFNSPQGTQADRWNV